MRVGELIARKGGVITTITPDQNVAAAARLLIQHNIGGLPVIAGDGSLSGFIAERDIVRAVDRHGEDALRLPVQRVMRRPAPVCSTGDALYDVMAMMTRDRLRHLVVLDGDRTAGVLSVGDMVKHRLEELETELGVLRDYVAARRGTNL